MFININFLKRKRGFFLFFSSSVFPEIHSETTKAKFIFEREETSLIKVVYFIPSLTPQGVSWDKTSYFAF